MLVLQDSHSDPLPPITIIIANVLKITAVRFIGPVKFTFRYPSYFKLSTAVLTYFNKALFGERLAYYSTDIIPSSVTKYLGIQ